MCWANWATYLKLLGKKPLVLWDPVVEALVGATVEQSLQQAGLEMVEVDFAGEASAAERARVGKIARESGADMAVGVGGGKVLDVAKAVAVDNHIGMVTCPTIASNDSPTSAASVWYDDNHNFVGFDCWPFNPDIVLVDTQVIANGPVRAFVAGMGDALSTWVEAEAAFKSRAQNIAGGRPTMAAMMLARVVLRDVARARPGCQTRRRTPRGHARCGESRRSQRAALRDWVSRAADWRRPT